MVSGSAQDSAEDFAEWSRIALIGVSLTGAISFVPSSKAVLAAEWSAWVNGLFKSVIGPPFCVAYDLAHQLKIQEIVEYDRQLGDQLGDLSEVLQSAALPFIEGKAEMRGHREWSKYEQKVAAGDAPGHLPIMFALHSVLFKLPLFSALQSYAWMEWKMGHHSVGLYDQVRLVSETEPMFFEVSQAIASIVGSLNEATETDRLRVV